MPLIGEHFTVLQSVDSTNNYAMAQAHAGLAMHGNTYFSSEQTGGKGQRGKTWETGSGQNLAISVVLNPGNLLLSDQFMLNIAVTLACYDLVNDHALTDLRIKWPNDIYWRDRKAGGILIENLVKGSEWQHAIAGVGLNINQTHFSSNLKNPVSLKQITGKTYDLIELARNLCSKLEHTFNSLQVEHQPLLEIYNRLLYKKNAAVTLKRNNIVFNSVIRGVTRQGRLVVYSNMEQEYDSGEIEWVLS
ncbi:MAG: biotin--[acetyl-CoA-carboxylase] ligase [Chitinophagaceae bacterium]